MINMCKVFKGKWAFPSVLFVNNIRCLGLDSLQRRLSEDAMDSRYSKLPLSQTHQLENCKQTRQKDHPFPSSWLRLCRTNRVQTRDKEKAKIIYVLISLQLNQSCPPGVAAKPNSLSSSSISNGSSQEKGHPKNIYLYNEQCFVAAVKWSNGVVKHVLFIRFSQSRMCLWIQSNVKFDVSNKSHKLS